MKRFTDGTKVKVRIGREWVNGTVVRRINPADRPLRLRSIKNAYEVAFEDETGRVLDIDGVVFNGKNIKVRE